jgi:CRP-like cAMP-binding protein
MEELIQLLRAVYPLSAKLEAHLRSKIKPYRFKKGKDIVKAGEVADLILYLEKGFVRSYSIVKGKKASNYFMREGDIIISVESFLQRIPAVEAIGALEDCICWGITHAELEEIYRLFVKFNIHGRIITGEYYCRSEARHRSKHRKLPEEIYMGLMESDPELLRRAKVDHIASYLGVSRDTYHRVKRNYARKKRR